MRQPGKLAPSALYVSGNSFQIPAVEDENGSAQRHCRVEQRVQRILQNELPADRLLVRDRADHVQGREVRHEVGRAGGNPMRQAMGQRGKSAEVICEASDDEERKREYGR